MLDFPQSEVWAAFMDPEFVAQIIPGCDSLVPGEGEDEFTANLKIRIGPISGKFKAELQQTDKIPPESFRMQIKARGPVGFITGDGTVALVPAASGTAMHYAGEVNVGGRIASVGQRLIESSAKSMINKGIASFTTRMEEILRDRETS